MAIEVELDIFSGRRNPTWVLEREQEAEFLTLLKIIQSRPAESAQTAPKAPPLGYRGFNIRSAGHQELPELLKVYGGAVCQDDKTYPDVDRELEKWLLGAASPFVSDAVTRAISQKLGK